CTKCGRVFDLGKPLVREDPPICPACESTRAKPIKLASCDSCGTRLRPERPANAEDYDGLCAHCECDLRLHRNQPLDPVHHKVIDLLADGPIDCTVIVTGGFHVSGRLELHRTDRGVTLRMVSPDHPTGYVPDDAP